MRSSKYGLGLAITAACMGFGTGTASAATEVVKPGDIDSGGNWSSDDTRGVGSYDFVAQSFATGGNGSVRLTTPAANDKVTLLTKAFDDQALSSITAMSYRSYRYYNRDSKVAQAALNIRIDTDNDGEADTNLVYEPYFQPGAVDANGYVPMREWRTWDAFNGGNAKWWANGLASTPQNNQSNPVDWNTLITQPGIAGAKLAGSSFCGPGAAGGPDYYVPNCAGSFGVNQGSGNPGGKTDVDDLAITIGGADTRFDFAQQEGPQGNPGTGTPGAKGDQGPAGATGPQGQPGGQGAQGAQGTVGLTPSAVKTGKVGVTSRSLKASKRRKVSVRISCPRANGLCEGRLNLLKGRKVIARQAFVVRGGRSGKVTFTLSRKTYRALKKSQRVRVDSFSRDLAGAASETAKSITLTK